jgi:hypothetical protein
VVKVQTFCKKLGRKPACCMTLLAVNFKGRWLKELGFGTNLLVTILLVTLSPTDAGVQSRGGGENGVQVWLHLAHPPQSGTKYPYPWVGRAFYTSVLGRNSDNNDDSINYSAFVPRICCCATMPESSQTSCRNCSSSLSFHTCRFFKMPFKGFQLATLIFEWL